MTSREEPQTSREGAPRPAGPAYENTFLRALLAALTARRVPGGRVGEERAEYELPEAFEWPPRGLPALLRQAREALERAGISPGTSASTEALDRLARLARARRPQAAALARRLYADPLALGEDVFLARCLPREPGRALETAAMRQYLQEARAPPALAGGESPGRQADLFLDRTACLEQVSFALLWAEPHRFEGMRATFEYFRGRYASAYRQQHDSQRRVLGRLATELEEVRVRAQALARLNTLEGLGRPLGREALAELAALQEIRPCPREEPLPDPSSPLCTCGFALGDEPPRQRVDEAVRRVERALGQQMARLSSQAVRRILARPSRQKERLERFLQVVQASDVSGLVNVLDDELLAFLRQVLSPEANPPSAEAPPAEVPASVLAQLMRSFPIIGADQVDEATAEFQRLLVEALEQARRATPHRAPVVRLAPAPVRRRRGAAPP